MHAFDLVLTIAGVTTVALDLVSGALKRLPISTTALALGVGVLAGPQALGLVDPLAWPHAETIVEEVARLTIAIGVMGIALRLPPRYVRRNWRSLLVLLVPAMLLASVATGVSAWAILGAGFWTAALIGACSAPTDPVLASGIVTGGFAEEHLPKSLRQVISAEAGANDGLALVLVFLPILFLQASVQDPWTEWGLKTWLREIGVATALGAAIGLGVGYAFRFARERSMMGEPSILSFSLALSLATLGAVAIAGGDGIFAVFVAGRFFVGAVSLDDRLEEESVQESMNRIFAFPAFILLGAVLPWAAWRELGWSAVAFVAAVLIFRRLPWILCLAPFMPRLRSPARALFAGWFGPIGIAAVFYGALAKRETGAEIFWDCATLLVAASTVVHGATAGPLSLLYRRLQLRRASENALEVEASEPSRVAQGTA